MHAQVQAERRERRAAIWRRGGEAACEARLWQERNRGLRVQLVDKIQRARLNVAGELQQLCSSSWGSTWVAQQDDYACRLTRVRRALEACSAQHVTAHEVLAHLAAIQQLLGLHAAH